MILQKGAEIDYTPLTVSSTIIVDSTVGDEQVYNSYIGQYIPDYTIVPLILMPLVSIIDADHILPDGKVNGSLTNITWTEVIGTTSTVITNDSADYAVETSGAYAGRLRVMKNFAPGTTATLKFTADYVDSRTNQVHKIMKSYLVACNASSKSVPVLSLDTADGHLYNPLRDPDTLIVTASLHVNGGLCPAAYRTFVWDISRDGKSFETVGSSDLHYFIKVSDDTTQCTINQSLMGSKLILRCRAKYSEDGDPASVTLTDGCPEKIVTLTRRIPALQTEIVAASNIPAGASEMQYDLLVSDANGVISDYQGVFLPVWYGDAQNAARTVQPSTQRGNGCPCTLDTSFVHKTYGAVVGCDFIDRGPWCVLTDSDGAIMTDSDGAILLIH